MPMTSSYTYRPIPRLLLRYMFALGLVGACVLLCLGIPKVMAPRPFLAFWPVVVVAAEFGGIGPGLFATVASILCVHFILNPVFGGLNLFDWIGMTTGGIFLAGASVISIFIGRKRNIQSLQRLQAAAMQSATNGIALTDAQGVLLWANPAFCTMTGYTSEDIIGKINWLLDGGEQNEAFLENLWSTVLQREVWHGELVGRRKDGTTYVEERSVTPVTDADGRIINCVIIMQDITERKRAEEVLQESEARYRNLMEVAPVGIAVHSEGKIVFTNPAGARLLGGTSQDQIVGRSVMEIIHPDGLKRAQSRIQRMLAGEEGLYPTEDIYLKLDGSPINVEIMATALPYKGKPAVQVIVTDITERKRADNEQRQLLEKAEKSRRTMLSILEDQKQAEEEIRRLNAELEQRVIDRTVQLEAANRELEAFSYSVSHDLRAPLRSIDGFCQALQEEYQEKIDKTGKTYLQRVRKATERMGFLIDDMLKLSRVTRSEFVRESIDLSKIVQEIAEANQQDHPDRSVDVAIQEGIMVQGGPYLMHIVLDNLIGNAWKFTVNASHPRIEFSSTVKDGETAYYIRDNGAGFDMAYVDKLFGAFQRLHSTAEFPGTGIGLATVQRIIYRHGGRVWAEGEVGKGATFYFTLPSQVLRS